MLKIALSGATGRVGQEIVKLCQQGQLELALVRSDCPAFITATAKYIATNLLAVQHQAQVVIDFSVPSNTMLILDQVLELKLPLLIATTGFTDEQRKQINLASQQIPILLTANTSLSVNILFFLSKLVAAKLRDYEVEISEAHHRYKRDAPSGTALQLGEIIAAARDLDFKQVACLARDSHTLRTKNEIGFAVTRGGDIVGKHDVAFLHDGESLHLISEITNRASYAQGALLAANWLIEQPAGFYSMADVLGLKE